MVLTNEQDPGWLDRICEPGKLKKQIPKKRYPEDFPLHPFLLSGLLVLVGLEHDFIAQGKFASAAHAKRAARDYARKPVDWRLATFAGANPAPGSNYGEKPIGARARDYMLRHNIYW